MINTKNFKNLLKPLILSKLIISIAVIIIATYHGVYSNKDNFESMHYLITIQQSFIAILFLLNGIEELRKPDSKKHSYYFWFITAVIIMVLNISTYLVYTAK